MKDTKIEWADHTLNFWWGCTKVSEACRHCYAESMALRWKRSTWGANGERWLREKAVAEASEINLRAHKTGKRPRVFVNSMSDSFEDHPALTKMRTVMLGTLRLFQGVDWMLLTKRPENVRKMVPEGWLEDWPAHVWIGTTVENQARAEERIPQLLAIPVKVRFLSCEPLLGKVEILKSGNAEIDWVICGGESGAGARPMHPDWARSLRDRCAAAGVPFFFKQWGEWNAALDAENDDPDGRADYAWMKRDGCVVLNLAGGSGFHGDRVHIMQRAGKKKAGRLLDGVEHSAFPTGDFSTADER